MTAVKYYTKAGHVIECNCDSITVKHGRDGGITSIEVSGVDRVIVIAIADIEAIEFEKE